MVGSSSRSNLASKHRILRQSRLSQLLLLPSLLKLEDTFSPAVDPSLFTSTLYLLSRFTDTFLELTKLQSSLALPTLPELYLRLVQPMESSKFGTQQEATVLTY